MKNKLKNDKRGVVQFIWAGAALVAAGAWLVSAFKPKQTVTQTIFQSIPIYVWIVAILFLLVLLRRRN